MADIPIVAAQTIFQDAHLTSDPQTAPLTSLEIPSKHSHPSTPSHSRSASPNPSGPTTAGGSSSSSTSHHTHHHHHHLSKKPKTTHHRSHSTTSSTTSSSLTSASISSSILHHQHPHPHSARRSARQHQRAHLPPLPDLRFEQSYLASIAPAGGDVWGIVWITVRDQVVFPLVQGTLFSLGLAGWRAWNGKARFIGRGIGARVRRWWWGVNGWRIPE